MNKIQSSRGNDQSNEVLQMVRKKKCDSNLCLKPKSPFIYYFQSLLLVYSKVMNPCLGKNMTVTCFDQNSSMIFKLAYHFLKIIKAGKNCLSFKTCRLQETRCCRRHCRIRPFGSTGNRHVQCALNTQFMDQASQHHL